MNISKSFCLKLCSRVASHSWLLSSSLWFMILGWGEWLWKRDYKVYEHSYPTNSSKMFIASLLPYTCLQRGFSHQVKKCRWFMLPKQNFNLQFNHQLGISCTPVGLWTGLNILGRFSLWFTSLQSQPQMASVFNCVCVYRSVFYFFFFPSLSAVRHIDQIPTLVSGKQFQNIHRKTSKEEEEQLGTEWKGN